MGGKRHLGVYFIGSVANNILGFVLLPLYLRHLSKAEFGVVSVLTTVNSIAGAVATAGILSGLTRLYYEQGPAERRAMAGTVLLWVGGASAVLAGVLLTLAPALTARFFAGAAPVGAVQAAFVLLVVTGLQYTLYSLLRLNMRATVFVVVSLLGFVADAALKVYLIAGLGLGVRGYFIAALASTALTVVAGLAASRNDVRFTLDPAYLRELLALGTPFVVTALLIWTLEVSDNLLLNLFRGPDTVAVYSVGYKVAGVFRMLALTPLNMFWNPYFFSYGAREGDEALRARLSEAFQLLALVAGLSVVGVSAGSADVIAWLDSRRLYGDATGLVPFLLLSAFLYLLSFPASSAILQSKQVRYVAYAMAGGAATNVALNLVLIPRYGFYATTATTVVGYAVYFGLLCYHGQRVFRLDYAWGRFARTLAAMALGSAAAAALPGQGTVLSFLLHELIGVGTFLASGLILGAITRGDLRELHQSVRAFALRRPQSTAS